MFESNFVDIVNKYNLHGDGDFYRYKMLFDVSQLVPAGIFVEVGFRQGTGMMSMIEGSLNEENLYVAIDPFGNIAYKEGSVTRHLDYTNEMRKRTLYNFHCYLNDKPRPVNFIFLNLESVEFIQRYVDGVPDYYTGFKDIRSDYSLVHLDGQHDTYTVLKEVEFFAPLVKQNGFIIIDNTEQGWMDMNQIEQALNIHGFVKHPISAFDKWAYNKV